MAETSSALDTDALLATMSLRDKIGQMLMMINAPTWPGYDIEDLIHEYHPGSVISVGYRDFSVRRAVETNNSLQRLALSVGLPLLNGGDFEQGLATQMSAGTGLPTQAGLGAAFSEEAARASARVAGREELAVGFNWTFSPCADVNTDPLNPVIGNRSFGSDTDAVCRLVRAQVEEYEHLGILTAVKHFPGHGHTATDSHLDLPIVDCDANEFARVHLPPFLAALEAGASSFMTAHIVVPHLDPELPATLSRRVLTGLLRHELGYDGIIITDMMNMKGVTHGWGMERSIVLSVQAGADVVMVGGPNPDQRTMANALVTAVREGTISHQRLDVSVRRVLAAKRRAGLLDTPFVAAADAGFTVGSPEHHSVARQLARTSIVLLQNQGILPFRRGAGRTLAVVTTVGNTFGPSTRSHADEIAAMLRATSGGTVDTWTSRGEDPDAVEIAHAVRQGKTADQIVIFTYSRGPLPPGQVGLVRGLMGTGKPVVSVSLGKPFDVVSFPDVPAALATFALPFTPMHIDAPDVLRRACEVLFGAAPLGCLPVAIPGLYPLGHGLGYTSPHQDAAHAG